ncbi:MAG TPA: DUF3108 domain-containing protein [Campylobacterales bacterium]|nr:DUF3108 domain-containing protein [Campylobacterales bacterium]HHS92090.1 DUF3108 domain-containing protein [Campylobacterales bacterium]
MNTRFILLLILLNFVTLHAETIKADYKVEFGIIGEIGVANAVLTRDEKRYEINVKLKATGLADTLSGGRSEQHISRGRIENGVMISDYYQITQTQGSKMSNKLYTIDHENKKVLKTSKRWKNSKVILDSNQTLEYYAKDDLLTLYFNLDKKIEDKFKAKDYTFIVVGAEKRKGKVEVTIPDEERSKEYKEALGSGEKTWFAGAIIHQQVFSSDKGELLLKIGDDGITQKAVLKDLILFGDIRAKRID